MVVLSSSLQVERQRTTSSESLRREREEDEERLQAVDGSSDVGQSVLKRCWEVIDIFRGRDLYEE